MSEGQSDSPAGSGGGLPSFPPGTDMEALQRSVDYYLKQGAYISAISTAVPGKPSMPILGAGPSQILGIEDYGELHRFRVDTALPEPGTGYRTTNTAGKLHFDLSERVEFSPDGYSPAPGKAVPPTVLDPTQSQSLAQLDVVFTFDGGRLEGFGAGQTYPVEVDGERHLRVGTAGDITGGSGIFAGAVGSYVVNGYLKTPEDHCLQVLIRLQDNSGKFMTQTDLKGLSPIPDPDPSATYLTFVGEQDPDTPPKLEFKDGKMIGGHIIELLRIVWLDFDEGSHGGDLRTKTTLGPIVARLDTHTRFNPNSAPGTPEEPFPFITKDTTITFFDMDGGTVGTLSSNIEQGRGYWMPLPDPNLPLPAAKVVGFGPIDGGTGQFEGAKGLFSVNSVITMAPTSLFNMYVFRFEDPEGKFKLGGRASGATSSQGSGADAARQAHGLQDILNQTACFNTLALPDPAKPSVPIVMPGDSSTLAGAQIHALAHRFDIQMEPPTRENGLRATNTVGQEAFELDCRWLPIPWSFEAQPGKEPPPTAFDPSTSQRFALMDGVFDFGAGNRLTSFGTGQTFPMKDGGKTVRIAAHGVLLEGSGQFQGLPGNFALSGFFTPPSDFSINLLIRIINTTGSLLTDSVPPLKPMSYPTHDTTYLIFRCENHGPMVKVFFSPEGMPNGVRNLQTVEQFHCDFTMGAEGPRCQRATGPRFGYHTVSLTGELAPSPAHPGSPSSPVPFSDKERFYVLDTEGTGLGAFAADVIEGRTCFVPIEGIPREVGANVHGGIAPVNWGTGLFENVEGIAINIGTGTVRPNQLDLIYIVAFHDPEGKFRA